MSSIIEGYSYDIFISYRQNDNKYDGWVTEFVDNLNKELEANIKDKISVYFDINPQDGLLETHSVDRSLEDKLKCLIFVPIISRTYCDSKSFAWQHEFCAFHKLSKEDRFGRDIRLNSGNVASRILPVKIHNLDPEDKTLLENEMGGVLRSIEFIYKSAGVNRPLRANEDHSQDNLNKTYYRDQINKVANALKEIITAIKKYDQQDEAVSKEVVNVKPEKPKNLKTKIIVGSIILLVLIVLGYFVVPMLFKSEQIEKSIAVLPFKLLSDEPDKQYLADGMMDAITLHLSKIKDLRVMSRTSVEQYRQPTKTTTAIGRELGVSYLLEGSFQKFGENVRLIVQLIKTGKEGHIWANNYDRNWNNVFSVQSEVAQTIARELYASITKEEKELIEKVPTSNMTAYNYYLKANDFLKEFDKTHDLSSYHTAVNLYKTAIEEDSTFAKAYTGLANAYYVRHYWKSYFKENYLDSMLVLAKFAQTIDNQLDEAYYLTGRYYEKNGSIDEALENYDKALKINPNYCAVYESKGWVLTTIKNDYVSGIDNYNNALNRIRGKERSYLLRDLGFAYKDIGFFEKAKNYYAEAFALDSNKAANFDYLSMLAFVEGKFDKGIEIERKHQEFDSTYIPAIIDFVDKEEAYTIASRIIDYYKKSGELNLQESHRVGFALWRVGKYEEARKYLNQQIKYSEESIKLDRDIAHWKAAYYDLAATYAFLGDKGKAYQYLDELNEGNTCQIRWIIYLKYDPPLASIRNETRFQKILQNYEVKYRAEHERVRKWLEEQGML